MRLLAAAGALTLLAAAPAAAKKRPDLKITARAISETFVGYKRQPTMKPNWQQLDDATTDTTLGTTWTWDYRAALG
jgi:hypothetical protein